MHSDTLRLKTSGDGTQPPASFRLPPWKVLVVDDDVEVHAVTKLALGRMVIDERPIELLDANSAKDAERILRETPGIAVILLDVVMESDHAGLDLVRVIREEIGNKSIRIILRTGHPGQAPEADVIVDYDINDYKTKSELTAQKLFSTLVPALRAYRDITALERTRRGLEKILESADTLFQAASMQQFASGVLEQLSSFIGKSADGIMCFSYVEDEAAPEPKLLKIIAAAGEFKDCLDCDYGEDCRHRFSIDLVRQALYERRNIFADGRTLIFLSGVDHDVAALINGDYDSDVDGSHLLDVFANKIALGMRNVANFERMMESKRGAVEASKAKTQFLASMSHELRTLLNAILGFGQVMQEEFFGPLGSANYKEYIKNIIDSGTHMLELVGDILDLAEIETNKVRLHVEDIDMRKCVERAVAQFQKEVLDKNIVIETSVTDPFGPFTADKRAVLQILMNLLSKSVRYCAPDAEISLSALHDGATIVIEVADNGVGIPAEKLEHIGEPFVRLEKDAHVTKAGAGLGLSIVKGLTEAHGGTFAIESEVGEGTKVTLTFPAAPDPSPQLAA